MIKMHDDQIAKPKKNQLTSKLRSFLLGAMLMIFSINAGATNYYWVGGSGLWSQAAHWSTSSGGAGGVIVPGSADNVFFDAGSGFTGSSNTVTVDVSTASCNDMTWTGAASTPLFNSSSSSNNLKIYGSLTMISAMNWGFDGKVYFEATTTGKTLTTFNKNFLNEVHFNGAGGGWTLQDAYSCTGSVTYLDYGHLNTNNQTLTLYRFTSNNTNTRALTLGSSLMIMSSSNNAFYVTFTSAFTFNAGTSTLRFTYTSNSNAGLYLVNSNMNFTFYNVEFTAPAGIGYIYNSNNSYSGTFNNVTFYGHGNIEAGNNTYNNLTFTAGKTYTLPANKTQFILGTFTAVGACGNEVVMQSSSNGTQASISKSGGIVTVDYVSFKDISAIGGATFNATNSTIISNTSGWNVTPPAGTGANYYWIGGAGSWSNAAHWSLSSGGSANPAGCIPGSTNSVFFDAGSGFNGSSNTVTVDVSTASCNDMTWTGAASTPLFNSSSSSNNLKIYGSLTMISAMNWGFDGKVYFEAIATGKTLTTFNKNFLNEVHFNGAGGGWTLQDAYSCTGSVTYLDYGHLNTNNQTLTLYRFTSNNTNTRALTLGSSLMIMSSSNNAFYVTFTSAFTFNAGTSTLRFTYTSNSNAGLYLVNSNMNFTFYNVEFTAPAGIGYIYNSNNSYSGTFNNVIFYGHGNIEAGNNTYNNLTFTAGKTYTLPANKTQFIVGTFTAVGACGNEVVIQSSSNGTQAAISKSAGIVTVDYVSFKDISATGGATFNATNSTIISNTSGWNVTPPAGTGANYYWIGGAGSWSNAAHWSLSSGGSANPAGCIPGSTNSVFFDAGSGFNGSSNTVTVDVSTASCNDMTWTGAASTPLFNSSSSSNNLKIYGSLTMISAMNWGFDGKVYFEATATGKTLTTFNKNFLNEVHFNGAGGAWMLQDAYSCSGSVTYLDYGHLNTNNQTLTLYRFTSNNTNTRALTLGSSLMIMSSSNNAFYVTFTSAFTFIAGTSTLRFTYTSNSNAGLYLVNSNMNFTFYNVEFTAPAGIGYIYNSNNSYSGTFNNVTFYGHGNIEAGNNTYNNLTFTAGKTYTLPANKTQFILGTFTAVGSSGQFIDILSSSSGTQTTLSKSSGCVVADYLQLKDSWTTGGASFYAGANSVNTSNNSGWIFSTPAPLPSPGSITGPLTACGNGSGIVYSINPIPGATNYIWNLPAGASITAGSGTNSITVTFGTTSGSISVYGNSGVCATSPTASINVVVGGSVISSVTVSASPSDTICQGTSVLFTATPLNGGTSPVYQWHLNNVHVGNNTTTYQNAGLNAGDVVFCEMSSSLTCVSNSPVASNNITIVATSLPVAQITTPGPVNICNGGSATINAAVQPGLSYQWQLNGGDISGANTSTYTASANGDYTVIASNNCGADTSLIISVSIGAAPGAIASITGSDTVCSGSTSLYNSSSAGATAFVWDVTPSGAATLSNLGSNMTASWSNIFAGNATISVYALNACDTTATMTMVIHVDTTIDQIYFLGGSLSLCQGVFSSGYSASCSNATGYTWTLTPTNAGTISGTGSFGTVQWNPAFTGTAVVSVSAYNNCGTSATLNNSVNIWAPPATPTFTVNGYLLTSSPAFGYQWLLNNNPIFGATSQSYTALISGYYSVVVRNVHGCTDTSIQVYILVTGIENSIGNSSFNVRPNPFTNDFTVMYYLGEDSKTTIELFDQTGRSISVIENNEIRTSGSHSISFNTAELGLSAGMYLLRMTSGEQVYYKKLIKIE